MSAIEAYLSRFLPIFIGIGVMLLLRSLNVSRQRVRIEASNDFLGTESSHEEDSVAYAAPDDELKAAFAAEVTDRLIVEGFFRDGAGHKGLENLALSKMGMIKLDDLNGVVRPVQGKDLTVMARDYREVMACMLSFCKPSGILLAYMIEYRLSFCLMKD